MTERMMKKLNPILPQVDIDDLLTTQSEKRQTAPEYSEIAYLSMLTKEHAIGNYLSNERAR